MTGKQIVHAYVYTYTHIRTLIASGASTGVSPNACVGGCSMGGRTDRWLNGWLDGWMTVLLWIRTTYEKWGKNNFFIDKKKTQIMQMFYVFLFFFSLLLQSFHFTVYVFGIFFCVLFFGTFNLPRICYSQVLHSVIKMHTHIRECVCGCVLVCVRTHSPDAWLVIKIKTMQINLKKKTQMLQIKTRI